MVSHRRGSVMCVSGPLYLLGALVYVTRFPECLLPGRFDYWVCVCVCVCVSE